MTYFVQAHRKGQQTVWFTDSKTTDLDTALAEASRLHVEWFRKVRVIDDNEVIHLRLPPGQRRRKAGLY